MAVDVVPVQPRLRASLAVVELHPPKKWAQLGSSSLVNRYGAVFIVDVNRAWLQGHGCLAGRQAQETGHPTNSGSS